MLAGCGKESIRAQVHNSKPVLNTDVDILNHLLHLEHVAIAAYTAGTPLLGPSMAKAGALFLNDELSHAGDLAGLIRETGAKPIKPAPSYALGHPRNTEEVLMLLHSGRARADRRVPERDHATRARGGQAAGVLDPRQRRPARRGRARRARAAGDPVGVRRRRE